MHERVVAEGEVDARVGHHRERLTIVGFEPGPLAVCKASAAGCDALRREVDADQIVAVVKEERGPPSEPRCDFQNALRWKKMSHPGEDAAVPLRRGIAPG